MQQRQNGKSKIAIKETFYDQISDGCVLAEHIPGFAGIDARTGRLKIQEHENRRGIGILNSNIVGGNDFVIILVPLEEHGLRARRQVAENDMGSLQQ